MGKSTRKDRDGHAVDFEKALAEERAARTAAEADATAIRHELDEKADELDDISGRLGGREAEPRVVDHGDDPADQLALRPRARSIYRSVTLKARRAGTRLSSETVAGPVRTVEMTWKFWSSCAGATAGNAAFLRSSRLTRASAGWRGLCRGAAMFFALSRF